MKKVWISILSILLLTSYLSACGEKKEDAGEKKIKIVTTIFPEYDWVRNIVGAENETIEVDLLVDSGADLHSFQPTAEENSKTKDQQILAMDSMQSVTAKDVADGTTYLSIMEENLSVLKDALK